MTQPTHDEVIAFVQNQIDGIQEQIEALRQEKTAQPLNEGYWEAIDIEKIIHEYEVQQASWVANRAGLERHKPKVYYLCPHDQWNGLEYETLESVIKATLDYEATANVPVESQVNRITRIEICEGCTEILREVEPAYHYKCLPCPTYTEIYDPIVSVM